MTRRVPALALTLVAVACIVVVGRDATTTAVPSFAVAPVPWMPALTTAPALTTNWFCPGVPATGEDEVGGEVVVTNTTDEARTARLVAFGSAGTNSVTQEVALGAWGQQRIDLDALVQSEFVAASVDVDGGGVVVEQVALHPAGDAVTPCAAAASETWFLADGFTAGDPSTGGSDEWLVLSNPYDGTAVVDLSFTTIEGERSPPAFQGVPIDGRSVVVVRIGELTRDEQVISVAVRATRGRVVAGRGQHYIGAGRLGFGMALATPVPRDQWWFADGARSGDVAERFVIYNPTDEDVEVIITFLGITAEFGGVDPITVPARRVVTFDTDSVPTLPASRHGAVVASFGSPSIVVDRVLVRTVDGNPYAAVVPGGVATVDGFVPATWYVPASPPTGVVGGLAILNMQNGDGTVSVSYLGPTGPVPVAGLTDVPLGRAGVLDLDLVDPAAAGLPLLVESTVPIMLERRLPRGADRSGTTQAWAIPLA
jgi:hypothetical protein